MSQDPLEILGERIACALETLVEQGKKDDGAPESVAIGVHVFYADNIAKIIESSADMFELLKALRGLEKRARKNAEQLLVNI